MRGLICWIVLMAVCSCSAQTSQEFHSRYGDPATEQFTPRPGVALTVEYGTDGLACQELLEAPQPLLHRAEQAVFMPSDSVTEVLEEVAPPATLGKESDKSATVSGCNRFEIDDY